LVSSLRFFEFPRESCDVLDRTVNRESRPEQSDHRFRSKRFKVAFEKSPTRFVNDDGTLKAGGQMPMGQH
jgi:hypothetical protein